jgi:molybdopterin-guanine dinucleotide biosynthesis protein
VTGDSGSGKTTLLVQVVRHLRACGLRVLTVKHASHGFDIDQRGKDSWRLFQEAESDATLLIADDRLALFRREQLLDPATELRRLLPEYDLALVEGFWSLAAGVFDREIHIALSLDHGTRSATVTRDDTRLVMPADTPQHAAAIAAWLGTAAGKS